MSFTWMQERLGFPLFYKLKDEGNTPHEGVDTHCDAVVFAHGNVTQSCRFSTSIFASGAMCVFCRKIEPFVSKQTARANLWKRLSFCFPCDLGVIGPGCGDRRVRTWFHECFVGANGGATRVHDLWVDSSRFMDVCWMVF